MIDVQVIHVLSGDHVNSCIPGFVEFAQQRELPVLLLGKVWEIMENDIDVAQAI